MDLISVEKVEILSEEVQNNVTKMVIQMAKDSEGIDLNWNTVFNAVKFVVENSEYGYYITMKKENEYVGLNIVHFQYDICTDSYYHWIGSLYIKEELRKKGLFSKYLLPFNISQLFGSKGEKFEKVVSLYVDNLNSDAEKVYNKTGFIRDTSKIVFEEDTLLLKSTDLESFQYLDSNYYSVDLIDETSFSILSKIALNQSFFNPSASQEIDIKDHLPKIEQILKNPKKGLVLIVKSKGIIQALLYGYFEVTDWRNNVFWWIYSVYFNLKSESESFDLKARFRQIVNSICKLNSDKNGCGVRFMIKDIDDSFFENTRALKSHYTVLEKHVKLSES